ncbi:MAG: hypothetical protein ACRD0Y_04300, partial [Terriglobales bacterium]
IGLNEARRAGIPLQPPKKGKTSAKTRKSAALQCEPKNTASHQALSRHARSTARKRHKKAAELQPHPPSPPAVTAVTRQPPSAIK